MPSVSRAVRRKVSRVPGKKSSIPANKRVRILELYNANVPLNEIVTRERLANRDVVYLAIRTAEREGHKITRKTYMKRSTMEKRRKGVPERKFNRERVMRYASLGNRPTVVTKKTYFLSSGTTRTGFVQDVSRVLDKSKYNHWLVDSMALCLLSEKGRRAEIGRLKELILEDAKNEGRRISEREISRTIGILVRGGLLNVSERAVENYNAPPQEITAKKVMLDHLLADPIGRAPIEDLIDVVKARGIEVGRVTINRFLRSLLEMGVLKKASKYEFELTEYMDAE
jgi:hypothetical protein